MKNYLSLIFLVFMTLLNAQESKTVVNDSLSANAILQFSDNFNSNLSYWQVQSEVLGSTIEIKNNKMEIAANRGCTIWFTELLQGPLMITYDAIMIDEGGHLDRVSDLNCFFMATDPNDSKSTFINKDDLQGSLGDYNKLKLYYVGQGGRKNTTTRFRRYPGTGERPMLSKHDLRDKKYMLTGNIVNHVKIIVYNNIIQYYRNDQLIFNFFDPEPYATGYFGFRTTINHMTIDNFRVYKLKSL